MLVACLETSRTETLLLVALHVAGLFEHPLYQSDEYKGYAAAVLAHVDAVAAEQERVRQLDPAVRIAQLEAQLAEAQVAKAPQPTFPPSPPITPPVPQVPLLVQVCEFFPQLCGRPPPPTPLPRSLFYSFRFTVETR